MGKLSSCQRHSRVVWRCLSQSPLVSPGSSVGLVGIQRGHTETCWALPCSIGTRSPPPWLSPGMVSLQHHHPCIPPAAPMALTATSMQEDEFWGASAVVAPPKRVSQTTEHRANPVTMCAISLGMGLTITYGSLQGVGLIAPFLFMRRKPLLPPCFHLSLLCCADGAQNPFVEHQYKAKKQPTGGFNFPDDLEFFQYSKMHLLFLTQTLCVYICVYIYIYIWFSLI